MPRAIAVRPMTHDLVVAMESTYSSAGGTAQVQHLEQYSADGKTLHAASVTSYEVAPGETPSTSMSGLLVGSNANGGYAMTVGSAKSSEVNGIDHDVVVTRMLASDEIFTDTFDGSSSD